jgi:hypothetical protein
MNAQIRAAAEDLQGMTAIMQLDASHIADIIARHLAPWKQAADGMASQLEKANLAIWLGTQLSVSAFTIRIKGKDYTPEEILSALVEARDDNKRSLTNYRALAQDQPEGDKA